MKLTQRMVNAIVRDLFTCGSGEVATRLILVNEAHGKPGNDLGGLSEAAVISQLCEWLGVEE